MTERPWDFRTTIEELLARQGTDDGWRRWSELQGAGERAVARARETDEAGLARWLDENADVLIAQQLLVHAVHRQRQPSQDLRDRLGQWLKSRAGSPVGTADAVAWLKEEDPALFRAWLLEHVDELVEREIGELGGAADPGE